jgi:N-acetylmuramoyl-L-alanine amidase
MRISGRVSWFGGPDDQGVTASEDLAFWEEYSQVAKPDELFLREQPPGTTGLARRLDGNSYYIACRWDYDVYPKSHRAPKTGRQFLARPCDWGPAGPESDHDTGRVADVSPGLLSALGITTDDTVEVIYPFGEEDTAVAIHRVAISAGHGKYVHGASGVGSLEEHEETPKVMRAVAAELRKRGVSTSEFWDQVSTTQDANLDAIIRWHNELDRDLDVSCHFNSSDNAAAHGAEVWYATQQELAARVSAAIATNGLTDRGAKYDDRGLAFLQKTEMPAILIETCFITNGGDADIYAGRFDQICASIAAAIAGVQAPPVRPPLPPETEAKTVAIEMTVPDGVDIELSINGERVFLSRRRRAGRCGIPDAPPG